ncbi:MAG: phospho-sugar mutase, partial [Clostridia bacterium]
KVRLVKDFLAGTSTDASSGKAQKMEYPQSDVLYFAMEGGHFVCVRPSGTEPKIKLYVNVNDRDEQKAKQLMERLTMDARELLKS